MPSLPDIFKQRGRSGTDGSVLIPDVEPEPPPEEPPAWTPPAEPEPAGTAESELPPSEPQPVRQPVLSRMELAEYYRKELEDVRQEAAEKAYADALNRKRGELQDCLAQVDQQLAQMQQLHLQFMEQFAGELKYMAIEIAEKMILTKISEDDLVLKKLVMQMVNSVKTAGWLRVELSERLVALVDFLKQELAKPEYHGRLACPDDTCRVSTDDGTIVGTVSVQAKNLREAFAQAETE